VTFCRMIPYDGTPIKDELIRSGRLKGDVCNPGYDFLDPRLDNFYHSLTRVIDLTGWVHGYSSLSPKINVAWTEVAVLERLFSPLATMAAYKAALRKFTRESNDVLFQVVEDTAREFSDNVPNTWSKERLNQECNRFLSGLLQLRDNFILENQATLLRVLERRPMTHKVCA
jgi:anaerobic magnesium-protoporphyrin IX monomethyl ester cyclase